MIPRSTGRPFTINTSEYNNFLCTRTRYPGYEVSNWYRTHTHLHYYFIISVTGRTIKPRVGAALWQRKTDEAATVSSSGATAVIDAA